jgi:pimeloyl-ACP methyl ester carboxylesterase
VVHRKGDRAVPVERGQELARTIPGARYVELQGDDHPPMIGDSDSVLREITAFLAELKA